MKSLKICFIGVGSIAKRHIRNLYEVCEGLCIAVSIDAVRREKLSIEGVEHIYTENDDIPKDYDVIFITNPTELHLETLQRYQGNARHFFIEKPVIAAGQISKATNMLLRQDSVYYVACPLRYNAVIRYIKAHVEPNDVISVRSISSSFLPDWKPNQDYRKSYSAHKDMGGGVSIDLIHEWDYLTYLFGWPSAVKSFIGKKSCLEIDSDDYAIYIADYENLIVELHLDYFGRKTIREVELITKDDTIIGDIENCSICFLKSQRVIDFSEDRDDYQKRELLYFLQLIDSDFLDDASRDDGFSHGIRVLKLTQGRI